MKVIKLEDEGLDTQHYTPVDMTLEGVLDINSNYSAYLNIGIPVRETRSSGYLDIKKSDGTTAKIGTLTTDISDFRFNDDVLNISVNKVKETAVVESYTLQASHYAIPKHRHITKYRDTHGNIVYTLQRWLLPRKQTIWFHIPALTARLPRGTEYVIDYSDYSFSGRPVIAAFYGAQVTLDSTKPGGILRIKPGDANGFAELIGAW